MVDKPVETLPSASQESTAVLDGDDHPAETERILAAVLAGVLHTERVPVDGHFFNELGADSLVMAHFCARVRKRADVPPVSMKDVYRHPTIRSLATALATTPPAPPTEPTAGAAVSAPAPTPVQRPAGRAQYVLCGVLQFLAFAGYTCLIALVAARGYEWISAGSGVADVYLRSVLFGSAAFLGLCALPVLAKWTLIGRWTPRQIQVWSLAYVRFWIVRTLVRSDPLVLFSGSPVYLLYLRALGAKVGSGAVVLSRSVPVCTDLLTIGDGTVIRKDSSFACYRAHAGLIQTGPVTFGRNVLVSEATVIDIDTSLGDGAQLGHASSLHRGQTVPDGEHWHGSPAQRTDVDYQVVGSARCGALRRAVHSALQLLVALALYVPAAVGGVSALLAGVPQLSTALEPGPAIFTEWTFYRDALVFSFVFVFGAVPAGLLVLSTVPRLLSLAITPGRVYCLYGFQYSVHRAISLMTNWRFLKRLFGDSSGIVHYLRCLGYDLSRVEQTGSNFGTEMKHETPFLSSVGRGTMIADGLSIVNADFSSTAFRVSRASIGPRNFLGNRIAYPTQGRTGDNCLLATKVAVPVDGEVREGVGLLGSPSFEIPRSVLRDSRFDRFKSPEELRRGLAGKNRHNAATMGWYLLTRWIYIFGLALLTAAATELYLSFGAPAIALADVLAVGFTAVYFVCVERVVTVFRPLRPLLCSIYDPRFWQRERYWKVPSETYLRIFDGTPFKNLIWRLLGVRIGSRVFDDGCYLTERTMATIGDGCTLNHGSVIQCHSQEDGTFKSDHSTIGSGCTLGVGAFVHYGVTVDDGAVLAPDSFLMKGETVPRGAWWGGNPARPLRPHSRGEGRQGT
ncbi:Pls/PosA family non-ribosomal peptide synthetase [Streptomyces sp. S.PNR 29]|uniref:Pls/PosA family non-ribosomal peptide synthetase n=1 Tax=Streptomyces sp. S.PNR 29 TaxID=2973805 RepID=UPI0025AF8F0C|nr:Pls/PosA family non-ribosomal peptide synthetase [Streptomyces sp. S.PNR 29]MDN0199222.1 phosphopantetheine-binding protein [Streptomyces sp. S.PNR 29]